MDALQSTSHIARAMPTDSEVKLDQKSIEHLIRSINATQIDLIGTKIIEAVANRLGPLGKALVMQEGQWLKGVKETMDNITMLHANMYLEEHGKKPFLSDAEFWRFSMATFRSVEDKIRQSFSMPELFSDKGLFFQLSDDQPMGFLPTAMKAMKYKLTIYDIPLKYTVALSLDKEETQKKGELVFSLKEISNLLEFSTTTFTIKELEADLFKALKSSLSSLGNPT